MLSHTRDNVLVVAIRGDFDVCQNLVKTLMSKESSGHALLNEFGVTFNTVNSINWGRILFQINTNQTTQTAAKIPSDQTGLFLASKNSPTIPPISNNNPSHPKVAIAGSIFGSTAKRSSQGSANREAKIHGTPLRTTPLRTINVQPALGQNLPMSPEFNTE